MSAAFTGVTDEGWRRDFRWRWAAFATSEAGSALGYSALPIVAVLVLGVSDFRVSLLNVLAGVVSALLALPMGPWIEHRRKLPVMVAADLMRFVVIVSIPVAALLGVLSYWQLCLVAVVQMVARLAFDSAGVAQLRTLVPVEHRAAANGRFETTLWTANSVGGPAGGVLISWLGATVTMAFDAVSFLVSALLLRRLRTREPEPPARSAEHHWARDITAGWRYLLRHRGLAALFWNSIIFGGCITALTPLLTVLMLRDLGFAAWQFGLVGGLSGVAGILGSMLSGRLGGGHRLLLIAGVGRNLWMGLIAFAPASTTGLVMIAASEFLLVFFAGMFNPLFATYRMNATDDAHTSRVVLAWSITNKTVQPVFIAVAGALAAATSVRTSLIVLSVVLLLGIPLLPWRKETR
ncbi:MFS transporter [Actinoplanes bogorensis]|uniref:MFS transporter n=1 Tax=Paractinoplanes bogorensis TaxID=1610840 RepID=A0ABS5YFP2_9ACTN|nr:MFS transporter [Actinoplanes bogorensis]MBU2662155.1 MFS transporter [Actinoplanes bogorensis]